MRFPLTSRPVAVLTVMVSVPLTVLPFAHLVAAAPPAEAPGANLPEPLARMQGLWRVVRLEEDGRAQPAEVIDKLRVIFRGSRYMIEEGPEREELAIKLVPAEGPRAVDFTSPDGRLTIKAIFDFEGQRLRICGTDQRTAKRPAEFATQPDSRLGLLVLERVGDAPPDKTPAK